MSKNEETKSPRKRKSKKEEKIEQAEEIVEKPSKNNNIIFFFIKLLIIFIIYDFINPYIYRLLGRSIIFGKFKNDIILEAVCFFIVLVIISMSGNNYIYTEKKKKFIESVKIGGAMFGFCIFLLLSNVFASTGATKYDLISLALYCSLIGLFEEFLCRGWIQNEFIERFSKSRGQVILSITLSALIFGGMHISNIWVGGQSVVETISQIIQATGIGIYLGAVYYRSKNIMCNAFLHGLWDFALLLGEINIIKECSAGNISQSYAISSVASSTLLAGVYILMALYLLRKSKLTEYFNYTDEEIKESENKKGNLIIAAILIYMAVGYIAKDNENKICYEYNDKEVTIEETVTPRYNEYYFKDNNVNFKLYLKDDELHLKDLDSDYDVLVTEKDIKKFMVVQDKENYHILVIGYNKYKTSTVLYYSSYLTTTNIINDKEYMDGFSKSFTLIGSAPAINDFGYFYSRIDDTTYPYIITVHNEELLLYEQDLYKIVEKDLSSYVEPEK